MEKFRVGLIGTGGRCGAHMSALLKMDDVQVVAVADPIEERRVAAAQKMGATRLYKDHREFYAHESAETLDAIWICIEPTAHDELTEMGAVERGIPFLVEKPMTLDLEMGDKIAKAIEEKNLITAVGFQDRYLDLVNMIKDELPKHKKGGLVYGAWCGGIPGVWWWQKKSTCGGQLVEQNIHLLDGLRYLFGEPKSVWATASQGIVTGREGYDTDDHSTAVIEFANNFTATLVSACYLKQPEHGYPFCGVRIDLEDMFIEYRLRTSTTFSTGTETHVYMRQFDQGVTEDRTFIDAIKSGDGSKIRSPYSDAIKTLKLGFAANKSMETGEKIIF